MKDGYDWVKISLPDLMYVWSEGNYVTFYEIKSNIMTRMAMKETTELLPDNSVQVYK